AVLRGDDGVGVAGSILTLERVHELVPFEDVVIPARLVGPPVLWVDRAPDRPERPRLSLDPDHDPLGDARVVDPLEHPLGEDGGRPVTPTLHARTLARVVPRIESWDG